MIIDLYVTIDYNDGEPAECFNCRRIVSFEISKIYNNAVRNNIPLNSVEELAEHEMRKQFLHDYLDALDQQTQAILKLYNSGYSQQEVADQFGIKRDTVGNLVKKHLRILKKLAVEKNLK